MPLVFLCVVILGVVLLALNAPVAARTTAPVVARTSEPLALRAAVAAQDPATVKQQAGRAAASAARQPAAPSDSSAVTTSAPFPVTVTSLARIRRQLREAPPRPAGSGLRLEYHVDVVGTAPAVKFFADGFKLHPGSGVQYGGMTHREFQQVVAPPWRKWAAGTR